MAGNITRRGALTGMATGVAASAAGFPAILKANPSRRPNFLFIMTDQEFGPASYPSGLMDYLPSHQWLFEKGTSFLNYHVQTTPCSPSRSNIYTGQHTQHTGIFINSDNDPKPQLPVDMPTIGTMLRDAGYHTSYKGKWHLSSINEKRGWDMAPTARYPVTTDYLEPYGFSDYSFYGEPIGLTWDGYATDQLVSGDAARLILDRNRVFDGDKPWFLVVNLVNPHDIMFYDATGEQSRTRIAPDALGPVLPPPGDPLYAQDLGFDLPDSFYSDDLSTKPEAHRGISDFNDVFYGAMPRDDTASWRRFVNYYCNCLRDVDRNVARLRWALEQAGALDNTIIIYTSDHGERAGAHGMRQKGGTIYREETNVPMFVIHPDVAGGKTTKSLMSAIDIAPTLLGLAGVSRDEWQTRYPGLKGVDVSSLVASPDTTTARDRSGHLFNYAVMHYWATLPPGPDGERRYDLGKRRLHRGIHDGRYKFARYFAPRDHHTPTDWQTLVSRNDLELYDTHTDPAEITNLAASPDRHRATIMRLNTMTNALVAHEVGTDDGRQFPGPAELYVTGN
ncbi:MAG: sulfatase-like hydrolase/transferase [Sphingomonadaceae bacterium]